MIKPPFTVLILKNSHHPVTIRVSIFFFILIFFVLPVLVALTGFGLSLAWKGDKVKSASFSSKHAPSLSTSLIDVKPITASPGTSVSENTPEITDLTVSRQKNGRMEISFSFINVPYGEATYIWAMINPDDISTGEMVIFPRNPTFRGFPLDFRNGILFNRSAGKQCKINLSDEIAGIAVKKIRILAYSTAGKVLVNKEFTINQNSGM